LFLQASIGVAELCVQQMQSEGLSFDEACSRIFMFNSRGLMTRTMPNLSDRQKCFVKDMPDTTSLVEVIKAVQPGALIGWSCKLEDNYLASRCHVDCHIH
jgi:malate dehydrogenase (oxaloacetate-decarboxylating)(NADP+)